jgi:hypothetical protein
METIMTRNVLALALAAIAATALLAPDAMARKNRSWELLGQQSVGFGVDRDAIQVGRDDGDFSKIQLRVKKNAIEMVDLKVVYGNGQTDDIPVRSIIRAGGQTRAIDLKGGERFIKRVEIVYRSKPSFKGQAVVQLWGRD